MPANPDYSKENVDLALAALLDENIDITPASLAYRLGAQRSTVTRSEERLKAVEKAATEQKRLRNVAADNKSSAETLIAKLAQRDAAIASLERRVEILIASHRAMLMAVGEVGGIAAWRKFFSKWDGVRKELEEMCAMDQLNEADPSE
jgi:hypothetical protein